jgi:tetratricopeptide (TPR) repeat protein
VFCFFFFFLLFLKAQEAAKSGNVLFNEALEHMYDEEFEKSLELFRRAAAKGHEDAVWILSVVDVDELEFDLGDWAEAFAQTDNALGQYLSVDLTRECSESQFKLLKKSAEGGCRWGQAGYALCFGKFMSVGERGEEDPEAYLEWLEKSANQNNAKALFDLGEFFRFGEEEFEKAISYHLRGAQLGWKNCTSAVALMFCFERVHKMDFRRAVIWSAQAEWSEVFSEMLEYARTGLVPDCARPDCDENSTPEDGDFNQLCYALGWGLYWHRYGSKSWHSFSKESKAFGEQCLDYYCACVELQQKSIFTFLLCWNRTTGRVKDVGEMIAQKVWEQREVNLVICLGEERINTQ